MKTLNTPEPAPKPSDGAAVVDLVIADLRERDQIGAAKYGTRLKVGNGRRPLVDAYQEVLDLAQYMRQEIAERCELDLQIAELTRQREAEERLHRLQTGDLNFQLAEARAALERQNAAMRDALEKLPHAPNCDGQYSDSEPEDCTCLRSRALAALNPTA